MQGVAGDTLASSSLPRTKKRFIPLPFLFATRAVCQRYLISASDAYSAFAGLLGHDTQQDHSQATALSESRKACQRCLRLAGLPSVRCTLAERIQDLSSFRVSDVFQHLYGSQKA